MILRSIFLFNISLLIASCVNKDADQLPVPSKAKQLSESDRKYLSYKVCQRSAECIVLSNACMFPDAINREYKSEFSARMRERQPYVYCEYKRFDFSKISAVCNLGKCEVSGKSEAEINLPRPTTPHKP